MKRALQLLEALLQVAHNPEDQKKDWSSSDFVHDDMPSVEGAHQVLKGEAAEQLEPHGHQQDLAIEHYTGGGYEGMNQSLRHDGVYKNAENPRHEGKPVPEYEKKHIEPLKDLTRNPTQHTFNVYRGTRSHLIDTTPGTIFQDKGFTSTSLRPNIGGGFTKQPDGTPYEGSQKFRIRIRPGTKGHYVGGHPDAFGTEREFVLHPGTRFRVGKTFNHPNGEQYTNLHIHSQEE